MLTVENTEIFGWEASIRGMRNPMNSWDKSDSNCAACMGYDIDNKRDCECCNVYVGPNDLKLMKTLSKAGNDHGKFLRMINVTVDITAPLYWWKEFDTYKVGTVANSCSTMHKIHAKEFTLEDFSTEHLVTPAKEHIERTTKALNEYRSMYLNFDNEEPTIKKAFDNDKKNVWWQMIQLLPSSYNQKRTIQLNYQVLKIMYHARCNHKLDEWHVLCDWMVTLPYFKELCLGDANE